MAYYLVQQWWVLPDIAEVLQMGDGQRQPQYMSTARMGNSPVQGRVESTDTSLSSGQQPPSLRTTILNSTLTKASAAAPSASPSAQHPSRPNQPLSSSRADPPQAFAPSNQSPVVVTMAQEGGDGSLAMGAMAAALPNYRQHPQGYGMLHQNMHRYSPGAMMPQQQQQQQQQMLQFAGQTGISNSPQDPAFHSQYIAQFSPAQQGQMASQSYLMQQAGHQQRSGVPSPIQQHFQGAPYFPAQHSPSQQQFLYYPPAYGQMNPTQQNFQGRFGFHPQAHWKLNQLYYKGQHRQHDGGINVITGGFHQGMGPGSPAGSGFNVGMQQTRVGGPSGEWNLHHRGRTSLR